MKDRRIWIIIGCILVVGIAITSYTSSVVKRTPKEQQVQVLSADPAEKAVGKEETELQTVPEEMEEESQEPVQKKEVASEKTALAEDTEAAVLSAVPDEESYTDRLKNLDSQIQKTREQETDSNVYSAKTSAETELKMWDGELSVVYNALLESLPQEEALNLANEEKDWLKKRESDAADSSGKTANGLSYASSMVNQTRERAYELAKRCDELAKKDEREDAVQ